MHIGDLTKSVTDTVRRAFNRDRDPAEAGDEMYEDDFIRERAARVSQYSDEEIERIGAEALAQADRETTLREAQALHERWKVQPGPDAGNHRQ